MIDIASLNPLGLYVAAGGLALASLKYVLVLRRLVSHWKSRAEMAEQKLTDAESLAARLSHDLRHAEATRTTALNMLGDARQERDTAEARAAELTYSAMLRFTTALNIAADARQERDTAQAALQAALSELARRPAVVRDARGRWAKSKV